MWYTPYEVRDLLDRERPDLCTNDNAEWLAGHLNKAFEKGKQIGVQDATREERLGIRPSLEDFNR